MRRSMSVLGAVVIGGLVAGGLAHAAQGDLDPSFGDGGQVSVSVHPAQDEQAYGSLIQPDGKLVVVGHSADGTNVDMTIVRRNKDGSADVSFGLDQPTRVSAGVLEIGADDAAEYGYNVALQPDGKILVVGGVQEGSNSHPVIVRLLKNGALDTTFGGGDGRADLATTGTGLWSDVAALPDGKLLVLGLSSASGGTALNIARYTKSGQLDTTYGGGDGQFSLPDVAAEFIRFAVDPAGRPTVAALFNISGSWQVRVLRLNKNGALDSSFGSGDGTLVVAPPSGKHIYVVATDLQADGKALVLGLIQDGLSPLGGSPPTTMYLARVTARGALDPSFGGGDGWVSTSYGASIVNWDLEVQSDGRIVLFGGGPVPGMYVSRYTKNGVLDTAFGASTGNVSLSAAYGFSGAIQPDGRLVAVGRLSGADNNIYVARLLARSTLRKGQRLSARSLLSMLPTVIPTGARFALSVARSSKGSCSVSRGGIKARKAGTCTVTVSMTPPRTSAYPRPKTVRSTVVLTVTN